MAKIVWDAVGEKKYELGTDHGVLYVMKGATYSAGVPWNGLTGVTESPSGAESNKHYADNIEYANILSAEEFGATIEAFTAPPEFDACDGYVEVAKGITIGQQNRAKFGFCYRTKEGNDTEGQDYAENINIVWGAQASPSERSYTTINDSPEPMTLSWEITTVPVPVTGFKPTAKMTINSKTTDPEKYKALQDILYGTDATTAAEGDVAAGGAEPRLPMPDEIIALVGTTTPEG